VKVLDDKETWKVTWGEAIAAMVQHPKLHYGVDYCLAGDGPKNAESRKIVMHGLYPKDWHAEVKKFYEDMTAQLMKEYSYKMGNAYQVDIVRDVAALANTHFSASLFSLPLKTEEHPHGIYTEQELYQVLSILFIAIFYDIDPTKSFLLRNAAKMLTQQLGDLVLLNVEAVSKTGVIADFIAKLHQKTELSDYGVHMIQRLLESGQSIKDVVWTRLMPTAASMVANQAQLFAQVLDYYLGDGSKHLKELNRLAKLNTPEADHLILK
jgi:linoleate 8R-lipoxygenase/9,12-octadecadienoate 8-hydroperoxide 8R-isomerase